MKKFLTLVMAALVAGTAFAAEQFEKSSTSHNAATRCLIVC